MQRSKTIECIACDAEIECTIEYGPLEGDDYLDIPEICPECGEDPCPTVDLDPREDFHADG
jgi:hypothetical protein